MFLDNSSYCLARTAYLFDSLWVLQRRDISKRLIQVAGSNNAAHYLGIAGLRQLIYEKNFLGSQALTEIADDTLYDLVTQTDRRPVIWGNDRKHDQCLALDLVRHANSSSLLDGGMAHCGGLDLGRAKALACNFDRVVRAAENVPVSVLVD